MGRISIADVPDRPRDREEQSGEERQPIAALTCADGGENHRCADESKNDHADDDHDASVSPPSVRRQASSGYVLARWSDNPGLTGWVEDLEVVHFVQDYPS